MAQRVIRFRFSVNRITRFRRSYAEWSYSDGTNTEMFWPIRNRHKLWQLALKTINMWKKDDGPDPAE